MILAHIITKSEAQANEISDFLLSEKLIVNAVMIEKVKVRALNDAGNYDTEDQYLILGKTKALLFPIIDEELQAKYKDNMPVLYSVPIVHMDWAQADNLVKSTKSV